MKRHVKFFVVSVFAGLLSLLVLTGCGEKKPKLDIKAQIALLKGTDEARKQDALAALSEVGAEAAPALKELIDVLKDPDPVTRRLAALVLGQIGKPAAAAVPDLKTLLTDSDRSVMTTAFNALRAIDPNSVPADARPQNVTDLNSVPQK